MLRKLAQRVYRRLPLPAAIRYWIRFSRYHRRPLIPWSRAFTAKLVRYMHSDYVAGLHAYVDKIAVRPFVAERVGSGYLASIYATAERFDDLDLGILPERFYLKANHGCGFNMPVPCRSTLDQKSCAKSFRVPVD